MPRLNMEHTTWAREQPEHHRHNLAESSVDPPDLDALGLPSRARWSGPDWGPHHLLERALGERHRVPGGRVQIAAGGSEANAIVFGALLEPGDEVLVESPGYEPHFEVPRLFGATVRRVPRPLGESAGTLAAALDAARTPATRMVVVTHLHNPSGSPIASDDLTALEALAERHGWWIVVDEIFRDSGGEPLGTLASRGPRWVTTSSLTKSYGLGGLRMGWIAGSDEVLARCAVTQDALSSQLSVLSIALALELVPHLDTLRARTHALLAENRARWQARLARGVPFATPTLGQGNTVWASFPEPGRGDAFAAFASRRFDLALTPGRFFGDSRGFRVAICREPPRFAGALDTFGQALAAFAAGEAVRETA